MKVLGITDEVTTCDCCGKPNLKRTFAIETDSGEILHYGSTCVTRIYGKKRGKEISWLAEQIAKVQTGTWERMIDLYARGMLHPFVGYIGEKAVWNNHQTTMNQVTSIRDYKTGKVIRAR